MASDTISIRRQLLALFPTATAKGILLAIIERADQNGVASIPVSAFADEIGVGRQAVRAVLQKLEANHHINQQTTNKKTNITFCNKSGKSNPPPTEKPTNNQQENQQKPPRQFVKPTLQEVRDYIAEKGYLIDAEYFWDYYESVNWMRGETKIKSWKLTLATWNKNNYGTRTTNTPAADKYSARRGTDVGNRTEADYGGPF